METGQRKQRRFNPLKISVLLLFLFVVFLFLQATVLRVEAEIGTPANVGGLSVVTLSFLVLFVTGVCYGLWILLVEHYIAFSLTQEWIGGILREIGSSGGEGRNNNRYNQGASSG